MISQGLGTSQARFNYFTGQGADRVSYLGGH